MKSIDTNAAARIPGVVGIINEKDIKGTNRVHEAVPDKPLLIEDVVKSYGDPIAIVAVYTREHARVAATTIKIGLRRISTGLLDAPREVMVGGA